LLPAAGARGGGARDPRDEREIERETTGSAAQGEVARVFLQLGFRMGRFCWALASIGLPNERLNSNVSDGRIAEYRTRIAN